MDKLTKSQIEAIENNFPNISQEYLEWMLQRGWGECEGGYMIYSSPALAADIFTDNCPENIKSVILIGDDMAGYSIGYIINETKCVFVGIDASDWEIQSIEGGLNAYFRS
jgi:hypothetical protein